MKEKAEDKIKVTITDTDGNSNEYSVKEPIYFIHPLFGSGYTDGYKKGQEDMKSALRAEIEREMVYWMAELNEIYRANVDWLMVKAKISILQKMLLILDTVKPLKQ